MGKTRLYMMVVGCKPEGRFTEQHDIYFGIGGSLKEAASQLDDFWPNGGKLHIDSWREVNNVDGYRIEVKERSGAHAQSKKLFFLNLGGYKKNDMEEYHYKMLTLAADKGEAVKTALQSAFYLHTGFKGAESHIDDKYGVDVDDLYEIEDILHPSLRDKYFISISEATDPQLPEDPARPGYVKLSSL